MSERFNPRVGASLLIGLSAIYLALSLLLGRSASAEAPPDLSMGAAETGIDVFKAIGAALNGATFADVRTPDAFEAYHIMGSENVPRADAAALRTYARSGAVIVVAQRDEDAAKLVAAARAADPRGHYVFLTSGVRDWYLMFDLPVALFNEHGPPRGYDEALLTVKEYVSTRDPQLRERARRSLFELVRMHYQPTLLGTPSNVKAAAGPRKKISGGCGG